MSTEKNEKNENTFYCEKCHFICRYKSDYTRHLSTAKHKNTTNTTNTTEIQQSDNYRCECGRAYKHRASMFNHKKMCNKNAENAISSKPPPENRIVHEPISESMVIKCFQSMMEAQAVRDEAQAKRDDAATEQTRLLIEAISLKGPQCITNNTTNNNNQFNLNVFLNEDCKDAFTLKEVIESIVCTVSDLDRMDTDGYAATITRKILESMQHMSITERPIHCTDARRNAVCVKNETGWERNEKAMKLLVNSVYFVGRKLGRMIEEWKLAYPDHYHGTVSRRDQFHRLVTDAMSVADLEVEARIASKVCKGVILDRKAAMAR